MFQNKEITAVIPALNEAHSVGHVVEKLLKLTVKDCPLIDQVVVCDNGSTDHTTLAAQQAGAYVVLEQERGYGAACHTALTFIQYSARAKLFETHIVLFLNADQSEDISEALSLIQPIAEKHYDLVIGSRHSHLQDAGAMTCQQNIGNWLVGKLVSKIWSTPCTDFGPYRAIAHSKLTTLAMRDRNFGWTVEMQVKAMLHKLRVLEVPVSTKVGVTASKISATWKGATGAALKMLWWTLYIGSLQIAQVYFGKVRMLIRNRRVPH